MLATIGGELRDARLAAGLSQQAIARSSGMSDSKIGRIEAGHAPSLSLMDAIVVAGAVGLDLSCKLYPGSSPIRDAAQARKLTRLVEHAMSPLRIRLEAPLPARTDGPPERRAWDALIYDGDGETGVEYEQRLYDLQAQTRRIFLKWQDSGVQRLLVVIADTRGNRRVLDEFPAYLDQVPRLKTSSVLSALTSGTRPPTGWILF